MYMSTMVQVLLMQLIHAHFCRLIHSLAMVKPMAEERSIYSVDSVYELIRFLIIYGHSMMSCSELDDFSDLASEFDLTDGNEILLPLLLPFPALIVHNSARLIILRAVAVSMSKFLWLFCSFGSLRDTYAIV